MRRPFVLLSVAASLDGFIDDASSERLVLSNDEDLDRVDAVRAESDAILVGANTIRRDDPRLLVRSEERRAKRVADGRPERPLKVTVTAGGGLDPEARFFAAGGGAPLVYTTTAAHASVFARLGAVAEIVDAGDPLSLQVLLADLAGRGVERLMVEGGQSLHTAFLAAGLVDELQLVLAPFLLGSDGAARFVGPARFPQDSRHRMALVESRQLGDVVLLRYQPQVSDA